MINQIRAGIFQKWIDFEYCIARTGTATPFRTSEREVKTAYLDREMDKKFDIGLKWILNQGLKYESKPFSEIEINSEVITLSEGASTEETS